jgi:integrase
VNFATSPGVGAEVAALTSEEMAVLHRVLARRHCRLSAEDRRRLRRFIDPAIAALRDLGYRAKSIYIPVATAMLVGTHVYGNSPDNWTPNQWRRLPEQERCKRLRHYLAIVAVRAYGQRAAQFLSGASPLARATLARTLVGRAVARREAILAGQRLTGMGYALNTRRRIIETCVTCLLGASEKHRLMDVTAEEFARFVAQPLSGLMRQAAVSLSAALVDLGVLAQRYSRIRVGNRGPQLVEPLIDAQWLSWKTRWQEMSLLSERSKVGRSSDIMTAGRWLKRYHPRVCTPQQWSFDLAVEYVRFVDQMRVGELLEHPRANLAMGAPLSPNAKIALLRGIRGFFVELAEAELIPRTFNFERAFRTPRQILRSRHRMPRPIDDAFWLKLQTAALSLTAADLPGGGKSGSYIYPFALVRALALTWVFSGCRSNEIERLCVGCVSLSRVPATVDRHSGKEDQGFDQYMLRVPVSKTMKEFVKPIEAPMAEAILGWERMRPVQSAVPDSTTKELVHYLFSYRGKQVGAAVCNHVVIPLLLRKAGLPTCDSRGPITSHRARATLATRLYNARSGLKPVEIMNWLGHADFGSTQYYLEITPTALMRSFYATSKISETARYVSVLYDRQAPSGDPPLLYDLGHGWCTNEAFASCTHRMACAKCDFYRPDKELRARVEQQSARYVRFLQRLDLTDDERAAVAADEAAARKLVQSIDRGEHQPVGDSGIARTTETVDQP